MKRFLISIFYSTYIFLVTSGKTQFNEDYINHHDNYDEPQDDGGCPPSMGMFLTTLFHLTSQVLHHINHQPSTQYSIKNPAEAET